MLALLLLISIAVGVYLLYKKQLALEEKFNNLKNNKDDSHGSTES
ncbi:MAG: hypothetical protein WCG27_04650 [Pseudomonadota bacterium]